MIYRPYISLTDQDGNVISDRVLTFSYEGSIDMDNLLRIKLKPENVIHLPDETSYKKGDVFEFFFGTNIAKSKKRTSKITNIETEYRKGLVTINIEFLDLGNVMKKVHSQTLFKNLTGSQIAQKMASKYGLESDIDESSKVYKSIPQSNRNDYDMLRYLAHLETPGDWMFYVDENTLHYKRRPLSEQSVLTIDVLDSNITSVRVYSTQSRQNPGSVETQIIGFDPLKKKAITGISRRTSYRLGNYDYSGISNDVLVRDILPVAGHYQEEINNRANSKYESENMNIEEISISSNQYMYVEENEIITLKNAQHQHNGNWLVIRVNHTGNDSNYEFRITAARNASKRPTQKDSQRVDENVNKSIGSDVREQLKNIPKQ